MGLTAGEITDGPCRALTFWSFDQILRDDLRYRLVGIAQRNLHLNLTGQRYRRRGSRVVSQTAGTSRPRGGALFKGVDGGREKRRWQAACLAGVAVLSATESGHQLDGLTPLALTKPLSRYFR